MEKAQAIADVLLAPNHDPWHIGGGFQLRQIYGHFLAPLLMKLRKGQTGLVAKDFNFPSTFHASARQTIEEVFEDIEQISQSSTFCLGEGVQIRDDGDDGGVVYTPSYNGYYLCPRSIELIDQIRLGNTLSSIAVNLSASPKDVQQFVAQLVLLDIIDVV